MENQLRNEEMQRIQDRGIEFNRKTRTKTQPSAEDLVEEIKQEKKIINRVDGGEKNGF
ncbi:hypothetical protein LCGC14_0862650 [marine sediment metagenome]|uniref:Uncharacterized protein n=1 Tax=marine sediment metagenome TaxID=412755 RepID=A0A0F9SE08_9ZZZZ